VSGTITILASRFSFLQLQKKKLIMQQEGMRFFRFMILIKVLGKAYTMPFDELAAFFNRF
jgi:hypothetical protein